MKNDDPNPLPAGDTFSECNPTPPFAGPVDAAVEANDSELSEAVATAASDALILPDRGSFFAHWQKIIPSFAGVIAWNSLQARLLVTKPVPALN